MKKSSRHRTAYNSNIVLKVALQAIVNGVTDALCLEDALYSVFKSLADLDSYAREETVHNKKAEFLRHSASTLIDLCGHLADRETVVGDDCIQDMKWGIMSDFQIVGSLHSTLQLTAQRNSLCSNCSRLDAIQMEVFIPKQ